MLSCISNTNFAYLKPLLVANKHTVTHLAKLSIARINLLGTQLKYSCTYFISQCHRRMTDRSTFYAFGATIAH